MSSWYKLDNAAKVFPSIYNKKNPNCFRLSALFYEEINEIALTKALVITLERYKLFKVKIRKGLFWYYFDENKNICKVIKENKPFDSVNPRYTNGFLFNLSYYGKRISLEIFHALTDANGGMEFLKSICFNYLIEIGVDIFNDGSIKDSSTIECLEEIKDDFKSNYNKSNVSIDKENKAFMIKGTKSDKVEIIQGLINVRNLKEVSRKYNATITQYLGGVLLYSIYKDNKNTELPIKLFIPINARKHFDSKTLRNFMLYIRSEIKKGEEVTLEKTIKWVTETLGLVNDEYLKSIIKSNVKKEKNIFIRTTPLFIKKYIIKYGYKMIGLNTSTIVFSNIGEVKTPLLMKQYIDRFEFGISVSPTLPIILSAVSYNNKLVLTFTKNIKERNIIKHFFNIISNEVEVVINTNL